MTWLLLGCGWALSGAAVRDGNKSWATEPGTQPADSDERAAVGRPHRAERSPEDLARLMSQLGSGSLAERDRAMHALIDAGPSILPLVAAARGHAAPEAGYRLAVIERRLAGAVEQDMIDLVREGVLCLPVRVERTAAGAARVALSIRWAPELRPLLVRLPMRSVVATGADGEPLMIGQPRATLEAGVGPADRHIDLSILVENGSDERTSVARLKGTLELWVQGPEYSFEFICQQLDTSSTRADTTARSVGTTSVRIEQIGFRRSMPAGAAEVLLTATLRASFGAGSEAFASHLPWLEDRLPVLVSGGITIPAGEDRSDRRTTDGIVRTVRFPWPPETASARLVWRLPLGVYRVPLGFELHDLPPPSR
jgi:phosphohistidine phosphatase SixA